MTLDLSNKNVHKIDITKEHCPMTFVKVKLALSEIQSGDVLEILLKKGEPLENVPKSLVEQGYKVLLIENFKDDIYRVYVEK
jgi:TusA-related sulfurtransferase